MENIGPTLTLRERDRRWKLLRQLMKARGLECLVAFGLRGQGQFDAYVINDDLGGIVILPREGEPLALGNPWGRVARHVEDCLRGETPWVTDIRVGITGAALVEALKEKGFDSATIGVVGLAIGGVREREGLVPYMTWSHVLKHLPRATFVDISQEFIELTRVKSQEELALLRYAARIGEMACQAMLETTRPGVSESEIYGAILKVVFSHGANAVSTLILHSGVDNLSWGPPRWIYRAQRPRVVQKGDLVLNCINQRNDV